MALEDLTGTNKYIANLVNTNPLSADDRREGDDHIRGIKNVLLNTFGAITGPASNVYVAKTGDNMTGNLSAPVVTGNTQIGTGIAGGAQIGTGGIINNGSITQNANGDIAWQSGARISMGSDPNNRFIRFTPDNSQLVRDTATGNLVWQATGVTKFTSAPNGNFTIPGRYEVGGDFGIVFNSNVGTTKYVAIGDPAYGGGQMQISFIHQSGVWAGIRMLCPVGQYQFTDTGSARSTAGGAWGTLLSDRRVKERITDYVPGLAEVLALRPRIFSYRKETGMDTKVRHVGLIAQEALQALPDIVEPATLREFGSIKHDDFLSLNITNITYALINAVRTLTARVEALEALAVGDGDASI
jgi:hypothetical protein